MDRQSRRIVLAYAVGLVFGLVVMFDKVGPWLAGKCEEGWPGAARAVAAVERAHTAVGLGPAMRGLDCALADSFDPSYKNTYRCSEALLAEALGTAPDKGPETDSAAPGKPGGEAAGALCGDASGAAAAPSPGAAAAAGLAPLTVRSPGTVLVVGDSLAIALAGPLERACKNYEGLTVVAQGKVASGLQNPQYYNWEQALRQLLAEHAPVLVVVMMGANDAKYLTLDPDAAEPVALQDKRAQIYRIRLAKFLRLLTEKNVPACWVGLPVMGDPELAAKSRAINLLARQACEGLANLRYLDTWPLLADQEGNYAHYLVNEKGQKIRVREGDKVHFSAAGGELIVRRLFMPSGLIDGLKHKDGKSLAEDADHTGGKSPAL